MKNTIVFLLLILFSNLTYAYETDNISTLRVGVNLNQPPFSYENQSGKPDGLSIKLWEEVAEKLNIKFVYVTLEGKKDNAMQMLAEKKLDVLVSPGNSKLSATQFVEFSRPYFMGKTGKWNMAAHLKMRKNHMNQLRTGTNFTLKVGE